MTDVQYHKNDPTRSAQHRQSFNALKNITPYPHGINRAMLNQMHSFIVGVEILTV